VIVSNYTIRPAQDDDLDLLPEIERQAARLFANYTGDPGIPLDQQAEGNSIETFRTAAKSGRLWVASDSNDQAVGFALVTEIDGLAHLEELDVLPQYGRNGLGSALVERVCSWATAARVPAVTLSTFRDVPWNGPFYRRRGFRVLDRSELSPGLLRIVAMERAKGLRTDLRVIMRRNT
jgi:GNAT superfamily N-acetyltransferase